ncbi:MAG: MBL fold metallo-hydrolase [Chloroflexaceae bacterium]
MSINEVARDVFLVRLPLPFALNSVNCYLLRDLDGWTVFDCGLHTPAGEAAWHAALASLAVAPETIQRIIVSHHHPDHYGMAGWLQGLTGAPVLMAPREAELAAGIWGKPSDLPEPMAALFAVHGTPEELVATIARDVARLRAATLPHPTLTPLDPGTALTMAGRRFVALHAPGHSDGQLIFFDEADGLLLCGDHLLNTITPHIGVWPGSEPNPLGRYLASLAELADLPVRLALPGHKSLIHTWRERVGELQRHHADRLAAIRAALDGGATAYEVARRVFLFDQYTTHEMRFAVAETIAHLEYLVYAGVLRRSEGEVVRYG